jgi:hypothetical protein
MRRGGYLPDRESIEPVELYSIRQYYSTYTTYYSHVVMRVAYADFLLSHNNQIRTTD